jgi:polysaccharide export outer membrane protein
MLPHGFALNHFTRIVMFERQRIFALRPLIFDLGNFLKCHAHVVLDIICWGEKVTLNFWQRDRSFSALSFGKHITTLNRKLNWKGENMTKNFIKEFAGAKCRFIRLLAILTAGVVLLAAVAGCQTDQFTLANPSKPMAKPAATTEAITLREGDVLKISFPDSPSLDTTQQIRRDGKISLPLVGEVQAAGISTSELESRLVSLYASQLVSKQITVEVVNSTVTVYVTGAVLRPGKVLSNHPMTALEAVMEAGGFDYTKADLKHVTVIRQEENGTKKYILDLKRVMEGETGEPFYIKPDDIIYVSERFQWF